MTKVLRLLEEKLQAHPQFQQAAVTLSMTCPPVAWVDDVAIPLAFTTPTLLDQLVFDATTMARDAFGAFGLRINMEKNKTEAVIQYRGQEAPQARLTRFVEQRGHMQLGASFNGASLRVVSDYQHLGTNFAQGASIGREVRIRLGKASTVYRQLRKNIFANRKLPIATRLTLLESLVLSIVFHGSGNWPLLPYRLMKTLTHGIVAWQRSIIGVGHWSSTHISDDELLSRWHQPTVVMRLAKFRILYGLKWYQQSLHNWYQQRTLTRIHGLPRFATICGGCLGLPLTSSPRHRSLQQRCFSGSMTISSMELNRSDVPSVEQSRKTMWSLRLSHYIEISFKHVPGWVSDLLP